MDSLNLISVILSIHTVSSCNLPSYMTGNWSDSKFYDVEFHGGSVMYMSEYSISRNGTTTNLTCHLTEGNKYVLRTTDTIHAVISKTSGEYYYYLCMEITKITDYSFYYYVQAGIDTNGERLVAILSHITEDSISKFCPMIISMQQFQIMVRKGFENQVLDKCSTPLLGSFSFNLASSALCNSSGNMTYSDNSLSTWNVTYPVGNSCAVKLGHSETGNVGCLMCILSGSTYITSIINLDSTIDRIANYKFTCLVVKADGNNVIFTQRARICDEDQTADTMPTTSILHPSIKNNVAAQVYLTLNGEKSSESSECFPKSEVATTDNTVVIVVVVMILLLLIIACIVGYICWKKKVKCRSCFGNREGERKRRFNIRMALAAGLGSSHKRHKSGTTISSENTDSKDSGILMDCRDEQENKHPSTPENISQDKTDKDYVDKISRVNESASATNQIDEYKTPETKSSENREIKLETSSEKLLIIQNQTVQSDAKLQSDVDKPLPSQRQTTEDKGTRKTKTEKESTTQEPAVQKNAGLQKKVSSPMATAENDPKLQPKADSETKVQYKDEKITPPPSKPTENNANLQDKPERELICQIRPAQNEPLMQSKTEQIKSSPATNGKSDTKLQPKQDKIFPSEKGAMSTENKVLTESNKVSRPPSLTVESESILQAYNAKKASRPPTPKLKNEAKQQDKGVNEDKAKTREPVKSTRNSVVPLNDKNHVSSGKPASDEHTKDNKTSRKNNSKQPGTQTASSKSDKLNSDKKVELFNNATQQKHTKEQRKKSENNSNGSKKSFGQDDISPGVKKPENAISVDETVKAKVESSKYNNSDLKTRKPETLLPSKEAPMEQIGTEDKSNNYKNTEEATGNVKDENETINKNATAISNAIQAGKDMDIITNINDRLSKQENKEDNNVKQDTSNGSFIHGNISEHLLKEKDAQLENNIDTKEKNTENTAHESNVKYASEQHAARKNQAVSSESHVAKEKILTKSSNIISQTSGEKDQISNINGNNDIDIQSSTIYRQSSVTQDDENILLPNQLPEIKSIDSNVNTEPANSSSNGDPIQQGTVKTINSTEPVETNHADVLYSRSNVSQKFSTNPISSETFTNEIVSTPPLSTLATSNGTNMSSKIVSFGEETVINDPPTDAVTVNSDWKQKVNSENSRTKEAGDVELRSAVEELFKSAHQHQHNASGRTSENKKKHKMRKQVIDTNSPYLQKQFLLPDYITQHSSK